MIDFFVAAAIVWFYCCIAFCAGLLIWGLLYSHFRGPQPKPNTRQPTAPADRRHHAATVVEPARLMTPNDHLQIADEREPAVIQADFRRDIPADPATGLRFHPHMTLLAAARICGERGLNLSIQWSKLGGMKVTTVRKTHEFLTTGAKRHEV
jgi:hypothetical protein